MFIFSNFKSFMCNAFRTKLARDFTFGIPFPFTNHHSISVRQPIFSSPKSSNFLVFAIAIVSSVSRNSIPTNQRAPFMRKNVPFRNVFCSFWGCATRLLAGGMCKDIFELRLNRIYKSRFLLPFQVSKCLFEYCLHRFKWACHVYGK